jgi:condensin-2 complex subunit H2
VCCYTELVLVVLLLQLATCGFYGDFLLLDPCDAPAVFDFLQGKESRKEDILAHRGGSAPSKIRNNVFASPNVRSGGTARKQTPKKVQEDEKIELEKSPENPVDTPGAYMSPPDDVDPGFPDPGCPDSGDDSDDEDPYKSLDPHEPSNLKIKPYKRGIGSYFPDKADLFAYISSLLIISLFLCGKAKGSARQAVGTQNKKTLASIFPVAKMDGVVSPQLTKFFEIHMSQQEKSNASQSVPLYEKVLFIVAKMYHSY